MTHRPFYTKGKLYIRSTLMLLIWISTFVLAGQNAEVNVDSLFNEASQSSRSGDVKRTLALTSEILSANPDHIDAFLLRGIAYLRLNTFDSAATFLNKVIEVVPTYYDAHQALIRVWKHSGKSDSVKAACLKALYYFPDDSIFTSYIKTGGESDVYQNNSKHAHTSFHYGVDFFKESFTRLPWHTIEIHHDLPISKSIIGFAIEGGRRIYGEKKIDAAQIKMDASVPVIKKMSLQLLTTISPYTIFDTLYPLLSVAGGISVSLPFKSELSAICRYSTFVKTNAINYSLFITKYTGPLLLIVKNYFAPFQSYLFYSALAECRLFISSNNIHWIGIQGGAGKSSFETGISTNFGEYIFVTGSIAGYFSLSNKIAITQLLEIKKAQYGYAVPYRQISSGIGIVYTW